MTSPVHPSTTWPDGVLLVGATVHGPAPCPPGTAVAAHAGRIVAVGPADVVAAALPPGHAIVDLAGRALVPGFIDAHTHPLPAAFFEHHLDLAAATSVVEVLDLLRDRATTVAAGEPLLGLRVDDSGLVEGRLPTRAELDAVGGGRPVVLLRRDGHHALGSSLALVAAGLHDGSADPEGGYLERDAEGRLSGLCGEAASSLLLGIVPVPAWEDLESATDRWAARLVTQGITGISAICQTADEGPAGAAGALEAVAWSSLVDRVPFDVQTILIADGADAIADLRDSGLHDPARGRRLDGLKLFLDGTLGGHSACLHHPYDDRPDGAGMLTLAPEAAYARMVDAHRAGLSVCVHAIGDRANRTAAELLDRLLTEHPGEHRHRVEHASVLDEATVELLARRSVAAVVQPISLASEQRWLRQRLGDERLSRTYPFRTLLDAGVVVASSSDAPIEDTDVVAGLHAAVDRLGIAPEQAVTPREALAMATTGAATARGTEGDQGRIAPGARADLVVLDRDPAEGFAGTRVLATVIAGTVHHDVVGLVDPGR